MQPIRLERLGEARLGLGRKGKCSIRIQCQFGVTIEYSRGQINQEVQHVV